GCVIRHDYRKRLFFNQPIGTAYLLKAKLLTKRLNALCIEVAHVVETLEIQRRNVGRMQIQVGRGMKERLGDFCTAPVGVRWKMPILRLKHNHVSLLQPSLTVASSGGLNNAVQRPHRTQHQRKVDVYACLYYLRGYQ